jgi:hypothetical protein
MSILQKYLKKLGVKSPTDLNSEDLATYKAWSNALEGRRLTDEDVAVFLDRELDEAVGKLTDMGLSSKEDTFLKMKVDFIRKIKIFLKAPEIEKKIIERQIESQLQ